MNSEYAIVEAFASPIGVDSSSTSSIIADKFFEQTRQRVLIKLHSPTHASLAKHVEAISISSEFCWRPEIGIAASACNAGQIGLAALQLIILAVPLEIECGATVESPSYLFLNGWILPVDGEVAIRAGQGVLNIESKSGIFSLEMKARRWTAKNNTANRIWQAWDLDSNQPRYIIESGIIGSSRIFPKLRTPRPSELPVFESRPEVASEAIATIARALKNINGSSAAYTEWLASVVDGLILTVGDASVGMCSPEFPGLVALNLNGSMLEYAERITSAACHQKLFQLALIFPLTEPNIEEVFYIPTRRSYITARRALAAAHEHVNAILMLRHLAAVSDDPEPIISKIEKRKLMFYTECFPALEKSVILTPAGKCLWIRLRELLNVDLSHEETSTAAAADILPVDEQIPTMMV